MTRRRMAGLMAGLLFLLLVISCMITPRSMFLEIVENNCDFYEVVPRWDEQNNRSDDVFHLWYTLHPQSNAPRELWIGNQATVQYTVRVVIGPNWAFFSYQTTASITLTKPKDCLP